MAIRFEITDASAKSIGNLSNGSMVYEYLEPGQHTFRARSPSVDGSDSITLNVAVSNMYSMHGSIQRLRSEKMIVPLRTIMCGP